MTNQPDVKCPECPHEASEHHFDAVMGCMWSEDGVSFCACQSSEPSILRAALAASEAALAEARLTNRERHATINFLRSELAERSADYDDMLRERDAALAVIHAPDSTNDGGAANLADEMRRIVANNDALNAEVERLREAKDGAYEERNRVVAVLARMALAMGFDAAVTRTAIEGWSDDWHGCVRINLPCGQVSWHFHDSQAHLFAGLPHGKMNWDGHTTEQKYERLNSWRPSDIAAERQRIADAVRLRCAGEVGRLRSRIAELEAAIRTHRERLFGDRPVTHDAHVALYDVLRDEVSR